ncbi:MAG: hypothetical protein ABIH66_03625 [bacterium]
MRKTMGGKFGWTAIFIIAIAFLLGGCGGGGGGSTGGTGGTGGPPPAASTQINIAGSFSQPVGKITGTVELPGGGAGRSAKAAVANTSVIAYWVKDGDREPLNSLSDRTKANGVFNITIDIGTKTNLDVVVEALIAEAGSGGNLRVAFDNLAADVSNVAGNATTTQSADFFLKIPDSALADIDAVVEMLLENGVSMTSIDEKAEVAALVREVKEAIDNCSNITDDATMKNCYVESIDTAGLPADTQTALTDLKVEYKVDVGNASTAERLYALDKTQSLAAIEKIVALAALGAYDNFDSLFSSIDTASELQEMVTAASYAIASYDSASLSEAAKLVAVKRDILASSAVTAFTNNDVTSLLLDIRAALNTSIANDTADLSAQVTNLDMLSLLSGYDIIEWMFLEVLTDQGFTREGAIEVFDALIAMLGYFGDYSDGVSDMSGMMDNWVTMWDLAAFQAELAKVLVPFDMGDTAKTDDLMRMARDLQTLGSNHTRAQVEEVLSGYLTTATTAKAMALYDKYYGKTDCGFDMNTRTVTGSNCPTQAEIIDLLETHFEKSLPLLDNTITAIGEWIQSPENDIKIIAIGTGARAAQTIYNKMKESTAYEQELSTAVDTAGVSSKLFELVINVEPYI